MPFQERFELLLESEQASEQSVAATKKVVEIVERRYGIQLTEELGATLVNHLAITLKRIMEGITLTAASEAVWQELQDFPEEYALAETIVAELEAMLNITLARDELGYIAIHLCKIKIDSGL